MLRGLEGAAASTVAKGGPGVDGRAALVVDVGSDTCRMGFAGEEAPCLVWPSEASAPSGPDSRRCLCFGEARGGVCDVRWDADLLDGLLRRAVVAACSGSGGPRPPPPLLVSEPSSCSRGLRETYAELLFESLDAPAVALGKSAVLSAFAFGHSNAMVVDLGAGCSSVACVLGGRAPLARLRERPFAGRALDAAVLRAVRAQGVEPRAAPRADGEAHPLYDVTRLARDMKETICFCSHTPLTSAVAAESYVHALPDGQRLNVAAFSRQVPELLLTGDGGAFPGALGLLAEAVAGDAGGARDDQAAAAAQEVLLLVGGSSLFVNLKARFQAMFTERMLASRRKVAPSKATEQHQASAQLLKRLKVTAAGAGLRRHAAWLGGSVAASSGSPPAGWATRAAYQEHGAAVFEVRCPA